MFSRVVNNVNSYSLKKISFCGDEEKRIIIIKKAAILIIIFRTILTIATIKNNLAQRLMIKLPKIIEEVAELPVIGVVLDLKSKTYLIMVVCVTSVVIVYSEIYIEHYNNKKFIILLISFFSSIVILASRIRILNVMVGWEILGLSSLLLIIFYPTNVSKFNSILTMTFNRIGDVLLIYMLGIMLTRCVTEVSLIKFDKETSLVIIICALTKRAQFPMSAWLPAAIRAPTPISAIVHSSTLVTAGIFLILKLKSNIEVQSILQIITYLRLCRFIVGGLMANVEIDFKKIIAFSTMSQIRIIIKISTGIIIIIALTHIFYHAIFKTLLFCIAGLIFINLWGAQARKNIRNDEDNKVLKTIIIFRIFSMRGIVFSASFFSKDLYLENCLVIEKQLIEIIITIVASFITALYCIKIISPHKQLKKMRTKRNKKAISIVISLIGIMTIIMGWVTKTVIFTEYTPILIIIEVLRISVILILVPVIINKLSSAFKRLIRFTNDVAHMKYVAFRNFSKIMKNRDVILERENIFLKKKALWVAPKNFDLKTYFSTIFFFILVIVTI